MKAIRIVVSVAATLFGGLSLCAAPTLKIEPLDSSILGITVTGPDDPGFQALAESLVPAGKMALATPYLSEAIIVANNSGQAIEALGVRFANTTASGQTRRNGLLIVENSFWRPVIGAGGRCIVTRGGSLQRLLDGQMPRKEPPAMPANLSVSIDLVVYADWLVAGPDQSQHLPKLVSTMHAQHDVCTQLGSGTPSPETVALLAKEAAAVVQPPAGADWYAWEFQRMAETFSSSLRVGDADLPHRRCAEVMAASGVAAALHR